MHERQGKDTGVEEKEGREGAWEEGTEEEIT